MTLFQRRRWSLEAMIISVRVKSTPIQQSNDAKLQFEIANQNQELNAQKCAQNSNEPDECDGNKASPALNTYSHKSQIFSSGRTHFILKPGRGWEGYLSI
jgi:hypothetical protein